MCKSIPRLILAHLQKEYSSKETSVKIFKVYQVTPTRQRSIDAQNNFKRMTRDTSKTAKVYNIQNKTRVVLTKNNTKK